MNKKSVIVVVGAIAIELLSWMPYLGELTLSYIAPQSVSTSTLVDPAYRQPAGEFVRDMGIVIAKADKIQTTDQLLAGIQMAAELAQSDGAIPASGLANLDKELDTRTQKAIGLTSGTLTPDARAKVVDVCNGLAAELGVK